MDSIDKINAFLAIRGWSGADLERAIGASHSVYSQWNTRQTKPSNRSLVKVAKALEVDIAEVLPDKEDTKNGQKKEPSTPKSEEPDFSAEGVERLLDKLSFEQLVELQIKIANKMKDLN